MKRFAFLFLMLIFGTSGTKSEAQISEAVKTFASKLSAQDNPAASPEQRDTAKRQDMEEQLRQSQLNELSLKLELEHLRLVSLAADSLKLQRQKQQIDSLRQVMPGFPVVAGEDTLFTIYAKRGGLSPKDRAEAFPTILSNWGNAITSTPTPFIWKRRIM